MRALCGGWLPYRTENADITDLLPFNFPRTAAAWQTDSFTGSKAIRGNRERQRAGKIALKPIVTCKLLGDGILKIKL